MIEKLDKSVVYTVNYRETYSGCGQVRLSELFAYPNPEHFGAIAKGLR